MALIAKSTNKEEPGDPELKTERSVPNESKIDMEESQKLKKKGNTEYGKKNYKLALDFYSDSLKCINIELNSEPPQSLIHGTDTEYYKEILNKIELNALLQQKRDEISKIFSNRAACFLNLQNYILCIHNCNISLLYNPNNENGFYRRALSYEKLEKYLISLKNYQKLLKINQNKKALDGLNRVQKIIEKQQDRVTVYSQAINQLKSLTNTVEPVDDDKILTNIGIVMNQIYHSQQYHSHIIDELGFTHILYHICLSDKYSFRTKRNCIRALNAIITHCTEDDKFSQQTQLLVMNGFECKTKDINYTKKLIQTSKQFLSKLIDIFEHKKKDIAHKIDVDERKFVQLLLQLLINIASNQYLFEKHCEEIFVHLVEYFKKLKYQYIKHKSQQKFDKLFKINNQSNGSEKKEDSNLLMLKVDKNENEEDSDSTVVISDILVTILKYLSNTALKNNNENYKLLEKIRYTFFYQFLLSDFSKDLRIKNEILRYFVCCSGLKSVFDQVNDTKLASLKTAYQERISQALTTPIMNALKSKQFTSSNIRLVKALRGLSIILQSNHKLGCDIAAREDILNCIVEVATVNQAKPEHKIDEIGYLGCEVLALSCSNAQIREAIIKSNNQHIFAWILDANDLMVRAYSANALSKFAAIDEDSRELALGGSPPNRCMLSCCAIIHYLLKNTKPPPRDDADGDNESEQEEQYKNYCVPLMNLCVETISYLSLHIETKLGIIHNKNEILKLLVSISETRYFAENRSLRHGLLTIILNCCLSKEDVSRFMSDKERQLHKLKKVVSKSLPNNPTKQDEIIQSRAGTADKIKLIQKELIKEGCIYLIYQIVAFTNTENKKIEHFIDSEIGLSEIDEIKIKKSEETRRAERYNWDPNKYANETEKDKLEKKKLRHLSTQKIKYRSLELEEKLQMKICQVLMMISAICDFRGKLVQQKAIRLAMDLFFCNKHGHKNTNFEVRQMSSVSIARICISINPILLNINDIPPIIECLLKAIKESQHELYVYESLLALCNISSLSADNYDNVKNVIAIKKNGWSTLRNAFEDEHDLINAAVLETWCNLCTSYDVLINKLYKNRELDIQIVTLFLQHDLRRVQRAAVSILAMASSLVYDCGADDSDLSKDICKEIAKNGGVIYLQCLLNIRQQTLIERFHNEKDEKKVQGNKNLDKVILERVRIVMANLEKYGYTMSNIEQHGMRKDVLKDFRKHLKK